MVDFHSHILSGVDDGSRSEEETYILIEEAEKAGFDTIISTSHYIKGYYEVNSTERKKIIKGINEELKKQNKDIKVCLGNEIYITNEIIDLLDEKEVNPIEGTKYVLFEMPMNVKPLNVIDFVYELFGHGYKPILAHPERYKFVQDDPQIITDLIEKGVLMQVNYGSVIGFYGKKEEILAKKFLESNMVHFLGSDVHRPRTVYKKIPQALEVIEDLIGKKKLNEITTENPESVLKNEDIETHTVKEIKFSMFEKIKFRK